MPVEELADTPVTISLITKNVNLKKIFILEKNKLHKATAAATDDDYI